MMTTAPREPASGIPPGEGLLYPQQNQVRNVLDLSGLWQFQLDPEGVGAARAWFDGLPAPRQIPVPCSWNDLFDDTRTYLDTAWYWREVWIPAGWRDQRILLRVGSANYAAAVWVNGVKVAVHEGGHLPFVADITGQVTRDQVNSIAIAVENRQLPERVPPGPTAGGGVFGTMAPFPTTTYDFFPYAGLHRPVMLCSVPASHAIDDIRVVTTIDGDDGVVAVTVTTDDAYDGTGTVRLDEREIALTFRAGVAEAPLRVPSARFWSPDDPHLYQLTVVLTDGQRVTDAYTLEIGIRTVAVEGDRLLLNGRPVTLRGFGKHEDFALTGRGLNLTAWVRDFELLRWVGANSFRTSHYPYAEEAMQLADRPGVLVINEIPAVGLTFSGDGNDDLTATRLAQCRRQLRELIARDRNHPSTIMWSVANEPSVGSIDLTGQRERPQAAVAAGTRFFRELYADAYRLDGTRPVTLAGVMGAPPEWLDIGDVVCINRYYGWYVDPGRLDEAARHLERDLDELHAAYAKPMIVTEFGADTLPGAHSTPPGCGRRSIRRNCCAGTSTSRPRGPSWPGCTSGRSPISGPAKPPVAWPG